MHSIFSSRQTPELRRCLLEGSGPHNIGTSQWNITSKIQIKLILHSLTYLWEHFLQIFFRVDPRCNGITEVDEVLDNTIRIGTDHAAHASKRWIFLIIVTNVAQWHTPVYKHLVSDQPTFLQVEPQPKTELYGRNQSRFWPAVFHSCHPIYSVKALNEFLYTNHNGKTVVRLQSMITKQTTSMPILPSHLNTQMLPDIQ